MMGLKEINEDLGGESIETDTNPDAIPCSKAKTEKLSWKAGHHSM